MEHCMITVQSWRSPFHTLSEYTHTQKADYIECKEAVKYIYLYACIDAKNKNPFTAPSSNSLHVITVHVEKNQSSSLCKVMKVVKIH